MDARTFGNYLSRMRKAQGMTQAELAEQLHVTDKAVSRWERGIGLPDINTLEPLADALGLTLADLYALPRPGRSRCRTDHPVGRFLYHAAPTAHRRLAFCAHRPAWTEHRTCLVGCFGLPRHHCGALAWSQRRFSSARRLDAFYSHFPVVCRH